MVWKQICVKRAACFFYPSKPQVQKHPSEHFSLSLTSPTSRGVWKAISYCTKKGQRQLPERLNSLLLDIQVDPSIAKTTTKNSLHEKLNKDDRIFLPTAPVPFLQGHAITWELLKTLITMVSLSHDCHHQLQTSDFQRSAFDLKLSHWQRNYRQLKSFLIWETLLVVIRDFNNHQWICDSVQSTSPESH